MSFSSEKIVIVGGGSAGWMTAATLIKSFPKKKIFVIESENIPTVGVGESTLLEFNEWLRYLDLDIKSLMVGCDASFKLGISFDNFAELNGSTRRYIFGNADLNQTRNGFEDWYILKFKNPELPFTDFTDYYYKHSYAVKTNRIPLEKNDYLEPFVFERDTAFQINAIKFANWLRDNYCIPKGVTRIVADVIKVNKNEDCVESLSLSNRDSVFADLFVDCTGFKSLILGKEMNSDFVDTSSYLPNNKAWFGPYDYLDKNKELGLVTKCTGLSNGWVWQTPLWSRVGCGYVYSDKYISDDEALEEFKMFLDSENIDVVNKNRSKNMDFKNIQIKNGYYKTPWIKNVVAIGLSHGFLEPMESTGLMFIHVAAMYLVNCLSREKYTTWDCDRFNYYITEVYKSAFSFVSAHYALSLRDDTRYWKDLTSQNYSYEMHDSIKNSYGSSISQVYVGWGHLEKNALGFEHARRTFNKNIMDIEPFEKMRRYKISKANEFIDQCPTHYEYLRDSVYNEN